MIKPSNRESQARSSAAGARTRTGFFAGSIGMSVFGAVGLLGPSIPILLVLSPETFVDTVHLTYAAGWHW